MPIEFGLDAAKVPTLLAGVSALGLALWLLFLNLANRLHRSFALFLALWGLNVAMFALEAPGDDPIGRFRNYLKYALPFVALRFALMYRLRYRAPGTPPPARPMELGPNLLLAGAVAAAGVYALRDVWSLAGRLEPLLAFVESTFPLVLAFIAFLFAKDYVAATVRPHRRSVWLASFGFALFPFYYSMVVLAGYGLRALTPDISGPTAFEHPAVVGPLAIAAAAVALLGWTAARLRSDPRRAENAEMRSEARLYAWGLIVVAMAAVPAGASILAPILTLPSFEFWLGYARLWGGILDLALPGLVSYAIVHHQLFDARVRIRWALTRGTVASVLVAVFFIVSETMQEVLGERLGMFLGIAATGLLVFAMHPLLRLAERVAAVAIPETKKIREMVHAERIALYREQCEVAWMDESLQRKERLLLDRLQRRMGLPVEQTALIEADVVRALSGAGRGMPLRRRARRRRGRAPGADVY